jgi:Flp pilus assembly protein TadB
VVLLRSKARANKQRRARITILSFSLLTLVPGVVLAVLVLLGEAQPVALIGAALMIGWAALRFWAMRAD